MRVRHGRKAIKAFINAQGCAMAVTQSRYARMHKDSHTKPLHDATAQMAVIAQMQRHKWLSMHRCTDHQRPQTQGCVIVLAQGFARMRNQQSKHDSTTPPRHTSTRSTSGVIIFGAAGGRTRTVRVRHGRKAIKAFINAQGCAIMLAQSFKQGCLKSAALS